tara:strand:+ start:163 stop:633 length:471 start_codon:yes stop_codon:yes gene_type:complete
MKNKYVISFLILLLFVINNCGFSPKYSSISGLNFSLVLDKIEGDRDLNNALKSEIKRYENINDSDLRIINVVVESKFTKITTSRNTLGEVTKYNLKANIKFDVTESGITKSIIFADEFKINKITDNVEEKNYIKIVKENFANLAVDKLISNIRQNK